MHGRPPRHVNARTPNSIFTASDATPTATRFTVKSWHGDDPPCSRSVSAVIFLPLSISRPFFPFLILYITSMAYSKKEEYLPPPQITGLPGHLDLHSLLSVDPRDHEIQNAYRQMETTISKFAYPKSEETALIEIDSYPTGSFETAVAMKNTYPRTPLPSIAEGMMSLKIVLDIS